MAWRTVLLRKNDYLEHSLPLSIEKTHKHCSNSGKLSALNTIVDIGKV
jgi:hypothetical protein